jgi:hypothetical protein
VRPWLTYIAPDRSFTAQFPSLVSERQIGFDQELPYLIGNQVSNGPTPDRHLEITYVDFLGALPEPDRYKKTRIGEIADEVVAKGGTVLDRRHVDVGTCGGEEVTVRFPNPVTKAPSLLKYRMFSSRGLLYLLLYAGATDDAKEAALANRFLNGFKITGGCADKVSVLPGDEPLRWFSGTYDTTTGWHRVESPYGASFLFPAPGKLKWVDDPTPAGIIRQYTYEFHSDEFLFSVEISRGYKPTTRTSPTQQDAEFGKYFEKTKKNLIEMGYQLGECKAVQQGPRNGRVCPMTLSGGGLSGQMQVFLTPTRNYFITAFRYHQSIDEQPITRFLDSVIIDPK